MTGGFRWSAGTGGGHGLLASRLECHHPSSQTLPPWPPASRRLPVSSAAARGAGVQGDGAGRAASEAASPQDAAFLAEPSPLSQAQAWGGSLVPRPHHTAPASCLPGGDLAEAGACRCQRSISLRCEPPAGRRAPRGQRFASPGSQRRGEACPALPLTGPSVSPGSSEPRCSNPGAWHCFLSDMIAPICARQLAPRSAILGSWLAADNTFKHAVAIYWPYKLILVGVQLIEIKA